MKDWQEVLIGLNILLFLLVSGIQVSHSIGWKQNIEWEMNRVNGPIFFKIEQVLNEQRKQINELKKEMPVNNTCLLTRNF